MSIEIRYKGSWWIIINADCCILPIKRQLLRSCRCTAHPHRKWNSSSTAMALILLLDGFMLCAITMFMLTISLSASSPLSICLRGKLTYPISPVQPASLFQFRRTSISIRRCSDLQATVATACVTSNFFGNNCSPNIEGELLGFPQTPAFSQWYSSTSKICCWQARFRQLEVLSSRFIRLLALEKNSLDEGTKREEKHSAAKKEKSPDTNNQVTLYSFDIVRCARTCARTFQHHFRVTMGNRCRKSAQSIVFPVGLCWIFQSQNECE